MAKCPNCKAEVSWKQFALLNREKAKGIIYCVDCHTALRAKSWFLWDLSIAICISVPLLVILLFCEDCPLYLKVGFWALWLPLVVFSPSILVFARLEGVWKGAGRAGSRAIGIKALPHQHTKRYER